MNMKSLRVWGLAVVVILLALMKVATSGQGTAPSPDALTALLTEVRGLRAAMEQLAAAGPRVQLAMGRLQLQEQRINGMLRRLDEVRDRLSGAENDIARMQQEAGRVQVAIDRTTDPRERADMESMAKHQKAELDLAFAKLQRLRAEHAETSANVAAEQGRWMEINQRLEELERALGKR